ncbi:MAG TPA: hypothetical protein VKU83_03015 [Puia sp.]|nr:hypothetical protein [Puia sp.]
MTKIWSLGFALFFGLGFASAQSSFRFRSSESLGISNGQLGGFVQVQAINGIAYGPWFLGAGAGLDYYRFRSVPLFLSAGRDLWLTKKEGLGLFLNGGTNLPWLQGGGSPNTGTITLSGGEYWSGGISYILRLGQHTREAVFFSVGYEVKKMGEHAVWKTLSPCYNMAGCPIDQTVDYQYLNRILFLAAGYRF